MSEREMEQLLRDKLNQVDNWREEDHQRANTVTIQDVWLIHEGGENDPNAKAVVLVRIDGQYRRVIEERIDGPFSHCVHANGIRNAPLDTVYVGEAPVEAVDHG